MVGFLTGCIFLIGMLVGSIFLPVTSWRRVSKSGQTVFTCAAKAKLIYADGSTTFECEGFGPDVNVPGQFLLGTKAVIQVKTSMPEWGK